jgi:hypothetical protein
MWSEVIENNRKTSGLRRERSKRFDPSETSSFSFLVIVGI